MAVKVKCSACGKKHEVSKPCPKCGHRFGELPSERDKPEKA